MKYRYFLKAPWQDEYTEVTMDEWIRAERVAGFRPKGIPMSSPRYWEVCATAGFYGNGISGRVEVVSEGEAEDA